MTKEQFIQIETSWKALLDAANAHYRTVLSTDDLLQLSVKDLQELIQFSKTFIKQQEMLFCDFRHLIGMGNLKVTECSKLTALFKDISAFRSDAKRIAQIGDILNITYIPAQSKYKLKLTSDITLISTLRPGQVSGKIYEEEDIELLDVSKKPMVYKDITNKLIVEVNNDSDSLIELRKLFNNAAGQTQNPKINLETFQHKLEKGESWYGITPIKTTTGYSFIIPINHQLYSFIEQYSK